MMILQDPNETEIEYCMDIPPQYFTNFNKSFV